jgi:hypothetical protein
LLAEPLAIIMWKKPIYVLLLFVITASCQNRESENEQYSSSIISCINERDSLVFLYLDNFEEYLLKEGFVKSIQKESYLDFISGFEDQKVKFNQSNMSKVVFGSSETAWHYYSPALVGKFQICINAGKEKTNNRDYFNTAYQVLTVTVGTDFQKILDKDTNGLKYHSITEVYADIPENYFDNEFIHYCFLLSILSILN